MVNQVFHTCFHFGTFRRSEFVVCGNDRTRIDTQPLGTLFDDAHGLTHFFHTAEVTVVAVAVHTDGNIEIHFVVHFVRLCLTHVPFHAGTAKHNAGKAFLHGALRSDNADADGTLFPNTVVGQEGFECIDVFGKRSQKASMKSSMVPSRDSLSCFNTLALRNLLLSYLGMKSGRSR